MKVSSILSTWALALLASKSALVAANGCTGGREGEEITLTDPKIFVDSDGIVELTGTVTFYNATKSSSYVDVAVGSGIFKHNIMKAVWVDLCYGATDITNSGLACPADGTYYLGFILPKNIPKRKAKFANFVPWVTVTTYQDGEDVIEKCGIPVTSSAMIWNGASSFLSVGAVALAVAGGLFVRRKMRRIETEDGNGSASFVEMIDEPAHHGGEVA